MLIFPNCKINLGLSITGKRADGYHDIETVFYPIALRDALEFLPLAVDFLATSINKPVANIHFTSSGIAIEGVAENNLCVKAYTLLKKDYPNIPPLQIHLHKAIPIGAGLGGGSADGSFLLNAINDAFHLGLSQEQLLNYALLLGSDCPFFIINQPCLATGRGEQLSPVHILLKGLQLVLVNPGIHIKTAWAFAQLEKVTTDVAVSKNIQSPSAVIKQDIRTWQNDLVNEFEPAVFNAYPQVGEIKNYLYQRGAVYAAMTGSGSTVFGLFERNVNPTLQFPPEYYLRKLIL